MLKEDLCHGEDSINIPKLDGYENVTVYVFKISASISTQAKVYKTSRISKAHDTTLVGLWNHKDSLYGYYIRKQPPTQTSIAGKFKRCLIDRWSPITGFLKFILELMTYGLDDSININEDQDHEVRIEINPYFETIVRDLDDTTKYASHLTQDFETSKYDKPLHFNMLFYEQLD